MILKWQFSKPISNILVKMIEKLVIFTIVNFYELEEMESIEHGLKMTNISNQLPIFWSNLGNIVWCEYSFVSYWSVVGHRSPMEEVWRRYRTSSAALGNKKETFRNIKKKTYRREKSKYRKNNKQTKKQEGKWNKMKRGSIAIWAHSVRPINKKKSSKIHRKWW